MNVLEETLRVIKEDISFHKWKLTVLSETGDFVNGLDIPSDYKNIILETIGFKMDYHNHKITGLVDHREKLWDKFEGKVIWVRE